MNILDESAECCQNGSFANHIMLQKQQRITKMIERPVFILGCPRTGTRLLSRIIGGCPGNYLVTEHATGRKNPEERSGMSDHVIWQANFSFEGQKPSDKRPPTDVPVYNKESIQRIRETYNAMAGDNRLVLKNPLHVVRVKILREIFPEALFIFSVRNPWHTLQSMTIKGNSSFLIRTRRILELPDNLLLRAAASWEEAVEVYLQERDENWIEVKHEDLLESPDTAIAKLFSFLEIRNPDWQAKATMIPRRKQSSYYPVRKLFQQSVYQSDILESIKKGCLHFNYSTSPDSVDSGIINYYLCKIKRKLGLMAK